MTKHADEDRARAAYEKLKASGMMWEFYPHFTGNYEVDGYEDDGFGMIVETYCEDCDMFSVHVVRPGKTQCGRCG